MKTLLILSALLFIAVTADVESEQKKYLQALADCEKEHGEPTNLFVKLIKGEDIGDEHKAGVMALCINYKIGQMNDKGEVIVEKYTHHAKTMITDEAKVNDILSNCLTKNGDTPEKAALNFVRCITKRMT